MTVPSWLRRCNCGHLMMHHDIAEYDGDDSDMCCVEGCNQQGCPGRSSLAFAGVADSSSPSLSIDPGGH